ncbi:SDR family NAD(P)-dependent oxidoreductase [Bacillus sp. MRMR6]|uniref:SDR family NAD(P)-dependent oxidoreductase n=1 Tax=Bacillus sp. MRMR6 TaxID=1928617 RepID=UPI0009511CCF|nr:SDR family NAD(P)-dependent oxidoreductase [Bacillus sp. MRMR6]OLS33763.1 hypothetical protein BTR25_24005 [Bacillus sp. MRMR6]
MNIGRFAGKVVMVTGIASGIGNGVLKAFANEGAKIIGGDINEELGKKEIESLIAEGTEAMFFKLDITDESQMESFVKAAIDRFGRIDVSCNCAGASRAAYITDFDFKDFEFNLRTCLYSTLFNVKYVGREMKKSGGGAIVNISSANSTIPYMGYAGYCSAKAGVDILTKCAALELAPFNIRVNVISPGLIDTPMTRDFLGNEAVKDEYMAHTPVGHPGTPQDIANAALYLADPNNKYVTGVRLLVDGGQDLKTYPDIFKVWPELADAIGKHEDQFQG